ncbi:MAG: hypothetical protein JXR36_06585 [Bacteroidales bacterium]|nr:hypothetical protein [Bacteroidales bacterium]
MDFTNFYNSVSESEKLKFLEDLLMSDIKLQKMFKSKVDILPNKSNAEIANKLTFAEIVANYSKRFEEDFTQENFSDVDWEEIYYPDSHYVEEWELVENHFADKVEQLYEPIKDLLIELLLNAKYNEILAAFCALYDVCQNLEIDEGDYCTEDSIRDSFSNCNFDLVQFMTDKIKNITDANKNIDDALLQFFKYFIKEHYNDPYFEKEIEKLIYALVTKSDKSILLYDLLLKINFTIFPKISSYVIKKNSSLENWLNFALKSYQKDITIAEELLDYLSKNDNKLFVSIGFTLINNPLNYKSKDFSIFEIEDVYFDEHAWNQYLYPMLNYEDHEMLYVVVSLNMANRQNDVEYYLKVREYLDENQKKKFISVARYESLKIEIYIAENKPELAKDIVYQNQYISSLIELIEPFKNIEPEFCFKFIISFIDNKICSARGRDAYSEIAKLLIFAGNLDGYGTASKEYAAKLCSENKRLIALKDEFKKAGLIYRSRK